MAQALRSSFNYVLPDGTDLTIRWVGPQDKQRMRDGIKYFSAETLYRRFFMPVSELSDEQLRFLTEVDQVDHIAWGALDRNHPEIPGLGVARCVRVEQEPDVAETAITVMDTYQGRGLGTLLLAVLSISAADNDIKTLRSYVLTENTGFMRKLQKLGAEPRHEYAGIMRLDLPVYGELAAVPDNDSGRIYKKIMTSLQKCMRDG
ncbi:MAG: GNAT family N-acetyltransferase [Gammaproteobacteria bacterium]|nr:GNAT family N-acetyltransferase [Gammaproteobacteria bacterium]